MTIAFKQKCFPWRTYQCEFTDERSMRYKYNTLSSSKISGIELDSVNPHPEKVKSNSISSRFFIFVGVALAVYSLSEYLHDRSVASALQDFWIEEGISFAIILVSTCFYITSRIGHLNFYNHFGAIVFSLRDKPSEALDTFMEALKIKCLKASVHCHDTNVTKMREGVARLRKDDLISDSLGDMIIERINALDEPEGLSEQKE